MARKACAEFSAYLDEAHETRQATGYMTGEGVTADFRIIGAVRLTRTNDSGLITDEIQSVRTCTCGPLTTGELFPQEKWSRWRHRIYDTWGAPTPTASTIASRRKAKERLGPTTTKRCMAGMS